MPSSLGRQYGRVASGPRVIALRVWLRLGLLLLGGVSASAAGTGPWMLPLLRETPRASWGARAGLVQEVYYEGVAFRGRPTRVFAYYGQPAAGTGPHPGMLLVHGGGGRAFPDWAEYWARRGYAALAMDTAGHGPAGPLPDGGPDQSDATKFREFAPGEVWDMWTYHAVAAVIRGHALLARRPEVDPERIGITGISWGGYLTCIVAGVDDRLKVAVPVYGCGFLHENSCWREPWFERMPPDRRTRWVNAFDPSRYLGGVRMPMLFLNGTTDFAYPLDSYQKSYDLVPGRKALSVQIDLPHGHIWTFPEVDAFVDHALRGAAPFPELSEARVKAGQVTAQLRSSSPVERAWLCYTPDRGEWSKRRWQALPAVVEGNRVRAPLPAGTAGTGFVQIQDARGLRVSTPRVTWPAP